MYVRHPCVPPAHLNPRGTGRGRKFRRRMTRRRLPRGLRRKAQAQNKIQPAADAPGILAIYTQKPAEVSRGDGIVVRDDLTRRAVVESKLVVAGGLVRALL